MITLKQILPTTEVNYNIMVTLAAYEWVILLLTSSSCHRIKSIIRIRITIEIYVIDY